MKKELQDIEDKILHMLSNSKVKRTVTDTCVGLVTGCEIARVDQNRIYAPYMTVYVVISLPKMPYVRRIYMVLANPRNCA